MWKYTVKVDGMMCGMCESHANDSIRRAFEHVKKVTSSHSKGQTVIITEDDLTEDAIRAAFDGTGYEIGAVTREPAKRGLFGW